MVLIKFPIKIGTGLKVWKEKLCIWENSFSFYRNSYQTIAKSRGYSVFFQASKLLLSENCSLVFTRRILSRSEEKSFFSIIKKKEFLAKIGSEIFLTKFIHTYNLFRMLGKNFPNNVDVIHFTNNKKEIIYSITVKIILETGVIGTKDDIDFFIPNHELPYCEMFDSEEELEAKKNFLSFNNVIYPGDKVKCGEHGPIKMVKSVVFSPKSLWIRRVKVEDGLHFMSDDLINTSIVCASNTNHIVHHSFKQKILRLCFSKDLGGYVIFYIERGFFIIEFVDKKDLEHPKDPNSPEDGDKIVKEIERKMLSLV